MQITEMESAIDQLKFDENNDPIMNLNADQTATLSNLNSNIDTLRVPLEKGRMTWLFGGLAAIILGLVYAYWKSSNKPEGWGAMKYPQLTLGMLAIFFYVGVEVALASNLGELLKQDNFGSMETSEIAPYVSMFWGV